MINKTDILFIDNNMVAISKPAGMLVHPTSADKSEKESAMMQLKDLTGRWVYPIHRLDKATSGVLIFGFSKESARDLSDLFLTRDITKTYLALVRGYTKEAETINYPLKRIFDKMTDRRAKKDLPPQEAITSYRRLKTVELPYPVRPHPTSRYSLVEVTPETGRLRQIRRHMKHIFHPIIGDHKHGDGHHNKLFLEKFSCSRLLLHAHRICFTHPSSGEALNIAAPLPDDFKRILNQIGILDLNDFL